MIAGAELKASLNRFDFAYRTFGKLETTIFILIVDEFGCCH